MRVLLTGATGYIGGRLAPRLLEAGHDVRVLVRDRKRIEGRPWAGDVEIIEGDLLDPASLVRALQDIDAAYYLVHSMIGKGDFAAQDAQAAANFVQAADNLKLVVYLGGLLPSDRPIASRHLRSRAKVGQILRDGLPTTEFQAGPIIGSGSASFEMVRYLTERLPAMIAPRWVSNTVHPISIRDTLTYLLAALDKGPLGVVPIGADRLTFKQMMQVYAQVRGLRRLIVPVPVLAPWLAALWVGLVTPISNRLAVPLVQGVVQPLELDGQAAAEHFPQIDPVAYRVAVERALEREKRGLIETHWAGAVGSEAEHVELRDWEGVVREVRTLAVDAPPGEVFRAFMSLGGQRGWLVWGWAWWLRGVLDKLVGGPGLRRGRRDPHDLLVGEALDWWRVEAVEPGKLLRLRAEMKVPGKAWLQWQVTQHDQQRTQLVQTATFEPNGLPGTVYWYSLYPLHRLIFTDLARAIAKSAQAHADQTQHAPAG